MKRMLIWAIILVGIVSSLVAQPLREQPRKAANIAVMAGPTGFSSVGLGRVLSEDAFTLTVYPSPNEVIARLANGEVDIAALPSNVAANLYNKAVAIKVAAVIGDGMLSVLSADESVSDAAALIGRTIHVPGPGSTPDQMARLLIKEAGLVEGVDVILDYSIAAPAQLAQMVIARRVELAILPEPFVTMVRTQNPRIKIAVDVQALYSALTGIDTYPMSVLVVRDEYAKNHEGELAAILGAYEQSVRWVIANPEQAAQAIEEASIMAKAMAQPAIGSCNLVYRSAATARGELDAYYRFLYTFSPDAIGGSVPGLDLYR